MDYLNNIFSYITSSKISVGEKLLLFAGVIIYVIAPIDLMPMNPLDDLGVIGIATAYINWRIKNIEAQEQSKELSEENNIINVQAIEPAKEHKNFKGNFFTRKR